MAILVNKMNREVKVTIPNMREFRTFYSDNEGVIGMFFKRDWVEEKQEVSRPHWKPSEEQMKALSWLVEYVAPSEKYIILIKNLHDDLKKLM